MSTKKAGIGSMLVLAAVLLAASSFIVSESDADGEDQTGVPTMIVHENCYYGQDLVCNYDGETNDPIITWNVTGLSNNGEPVQGIPYKLYDGVKVEGQTEGIKNGKLVIDSGDAVNCKEVYITQTVKIEESDKISMVQVVIHLNPGPQKDLCFNVYFIDGYSGSPMYYIDEIDSRRHAGINEPFVYAPALPNREGYVCLGWFINGDFDKPLVVSNPPSGDMTVIAKWMKEDSGSPDPVPPTPKPVLESIYTAGNIITDYNLGDKLNTTGMAIMAKYSDGTSIEVTLHSTYSPTKFDKPGSTLVTATYKDMTTSFAVTVSEYNPGGDVEPDDPDVPDNPETPEEKKSNTAYYMLAIIIALICVIVAIMLIRRNKQ